MSTLTARVVAYSENPATDPSAVQYSNVSFHKISVSGGQTVSLNKLVIVRSFHLARVDQHTFIVGSGAELRDGTVHFYHPTFYIDTSDLIQNGLGL